MCYLFVVAKTSKRCLLTGVFVCCIQSSPKKLTFAKLWNNTIFQVEMTHIVTRLFKEVLNLKSSSSLLKQFQTIQDFKTISELPSPRRAWSWSASPKAKHRSTSRIRPAWRGLHILWDGCCLEVFFGCTKKHKKKTYATGRCWNGLYLAAPSITKD